MTVAAAARNWQAAGFSTIPIAPNKSKKPAVRWKDYQAHIPSLGDLDAWWANGHEYGLALIMGKVSGNAEMLELEARACDADSLIAVSNEMDAAGVGHIWDMLIQQGYSEMSPYGGLHFIYRLSTGVVPGNEKLARRPATAEELLENPDDKIKVLSETRGEGGYVIVAPTSGLCHPSGESWVLLTGEAGQVPTLTWEERCLVHDAISKALDHGGTRAVLPLPMPTSSAEPGTVALQAPGPDQHPDQGLRPGDHFERTTGWDSPLLLGGAGWHKAHRHGDTQTWVRPGKDPRDGISATTGRDANRDRLYVFSTSTVFPTDTPITKFAAYAILHHGGNHSLAAAELRKLGFGGVASPVGSLPDFRFQDSIDKESSKVYRMDDQGACHRLADWFGGNLRWVAEEKAYYTWEDRRWVADQVGRVEQGYDQMTDQMCDDPDPEVAKWSAKKLRTGARQTWVARNVAHVPGVSVSASQFNVRDRGKLNLHNGVLDLRTREFGPHDRELLLTREFNASYDPEATCPSWDSFMEDVLPDPAIRAYVQRAVGYSLLGDANERALFLVWGPSGTGKSQFTETIQHVFGDYGVTASVGAFMGAREKGPSNDVHRLRGKRFVSTSETADDSRFSEETVKRLTGQDTMSTRALYQQEQEWIPECAIWIATNHKPKFSSDDDAIWKRSKLLPFLTRFGSEGGPAEIVGYARKFLFQERDGILNWMLEGVRQYLEMGLAEPEEIQEQATKHRQEVDSVAMFLEDSESDGKLLRQVDGFIKSGDLYQVYTEWCRLSAEHPFGRRRFTNRVLANWAGVEAARQGGTAVLRGIARGTLWARGQGMFALGEQKDP